MLGSAHLTVSCFTALFFYFVSYLFFIFVVEVEIEITTHSRTDGIFVIQG